MFRVELAPEAERAYRNADRPLAAKLARCFDQLERDPRATNNSTQLSGKKPSTWRFRVGDWRVIYSIDDVAEVVTVTKIGHRSSVYE